MLQKGFLKGQTMRTSRQYYFSSIVNKATLYLGIAILILALIYMIINFDRADAIVYIWLPFIAAGVLLVFVSQLIKYLYIRKN